MLHLLLPALLLGCPKPSAPTSAPSAQGPLLEVGTVTLSRDASGRCRFDGGRSYVVSVHRSYEPTALVEELAQRLPGAGLDDDVVLDWFGQGSLDRVELLLGRDLDTDLAALLVELVAQHTQVPVAVAAIAEDGDTCSRSRAYVGSLVATDAPTWSVPELQALAASGSDATGFWAQVPPSGR